MEAHEHPTLLCGEVGEGVVAQESGQDADAHHPVDDPHLIVILDRGGIPPPHPVNNILSIHVINSINVKMRINRFSRDSIDGIYGIDRTQQVRPEQ